MKRLVVFVCMALLLISLVSAEKTDLEDSCGFFCKIKNFFVKVFSEPKVTEVDSIYEDSETVKDEVIVAQADTDESGEVGNILPILEEESKQPEVKRLSIEEIKEVAIEEQIEIVEERAAEIAIADITVKNPKCKIELAKEKVKGNENVKVGITFTDELLKYEGVSIFCDQFERYGKSSDPPYKTAIPSSLKIDDTICNWGDVTTKTIYFVIVTDSKDNDLCAAPITVLPKKEDLTKLGKDGCFTDEAMAEMRKGCGNLKSFSLADAKGCETVYCAGGEISKCTPEALLEKATLECEAKGENFLAYKYSEWFEGQDWPCGQIRCSECPSEEELSMKRAECLSKGDGWDSRTETDFETSGCPYIICDEPGSSGDIVDLPPE